MIYGAEKFCHIIIMYISLVGWFSLQVWDGSHFVYQNKTYISTFTLEIIRLFCKLNY